MSEGKAILGRTDTEWKCFREGESANDNNRRVYRNNHRTGTVINNPYGQGTPEWKAWQDGYNYRDMVNDG